MKMKIAPKFNKICKWRWTQKSIEGVHLEELKKVFVLNELKRSRKFLQIFLKYCYILEAFKDDIIYEEGDNSSDMYIILEGILKIFKQTNAGEQFLLTSVTSGGGFFGEMGLLHCQRRSATVQADSHVKLLVLSRKDFIRMIKQQPSIAVGLAISICQVLADRLQRTNDDLSFLYDALAYEMSEI